MSCYDYTYYSIMRVWKQPISRPGCTLYGWCAPNGPPGCTGEAQYISLAPSSPACLRFQTRFFFFFSVARTAEWQSPCCKDHLVREKGGFNLPECCCRSDGGIPSAVWKLFCFQTSFPPFWRHLLSLKNVSHRKKKKKERFNWWQTVQKNKHVFLQIAHLNKYVDDGGLMNIHCWLGSLWAVQSNSVSKPNLSFFCMINNVGVVRPNVCRSPFGPRGLTFCRRQLVPRQLTSHIHSSTVTHCLNLITGPFKCPSLRQTCLFLCFRGWCLWSCRLGLEFFFMRLEKVQVYWSRLWRDSWKQLTPKTSSADLKLNSSIKISLQRKAVKTCFNFCKKASQIIRFEFERNIRHIRNTNISSVYDPVWSEVFHSNLAAVFDGALSVPVSSILSCLNKNVIYIGILY